MAQQIKFFKKNKFDFTEETASTATTNSDAAALTLDRRNTTFWVGDSGTATQTLTWTHAGGQAFPIDSIFFLLHNWNTSTYSVSYVDASDVTQDLVISGVLQSGVTALTSDDSIQLSFTSDSAKSVSVTATVATAMTGLRLAQFIATESIGQLEGWPIVGNNRLDQNTSNTNAASGRQIFSQNEGGYSFSLSVAAWNVTNDLQLVQDFYVARSPQLVWVNAGDESQFSNPLIGFQFEDIYLMKPTNDFRPIKLSGLYDAGYRIRIQVAEVSS